MPSPSECEVIRTKHNLQEEAASSRDATRNVARSLTTLSQDAAAKMQTVDALRQSVRRRRHLTFSTPAAPTFLDSLVIPDAFKQMTDAREFLLHDSGPGPDRIIVYPRKQICKKLWIPVTGSWTVHLKRRHRSSPRSTRIHVLKNGQALPMVFAMLPDNTAATYERLFRSVLQNKPELNPATVMT